jgi:hypothetical protein
MMMMVKSHVDDGGGGGGGGGDDDDDDDDDDGEMAAAATTTTIVIVIRSDLGSMALLALLFWARHRFRFPRHSAASTCFCTLQITEQNYENAMHASVIVQE